MPFDWNTYKDLAEELRQRDDEASKRSAVSRLYYSVYWNARFFLEESQGFLYSENKEPHGQIWQEFIRQGKIFRNIGENGRRLRNKRNSADYDQDIPRLEDDLEISFRWASQILYDLSKVQQKNDN